MHGRDSDSNSLSPVSSADNATQRGAIWYRILCFQASVQTAALLACAEAAPLYQFTCSELSWQPDSARLEAMQQANQKRLAELDAAIKDAEENMGDIEVRNALTAKADYLNKIGEVTHISHSSALCTSAAMGAAKGRDFV